MSTARQKDEWSRTASVLSLIYNMNRTAKSPKLSPEDFTPFKDQGEASPALIATPQEAAQVFRALAQN
jgi:hypothetical protein